MDMKVISVNGKYFLDGVLCEENRVGDGTLYVLIDDAPFFNVTPEEVSLVCAKNKISFSILDDPNLQMYTVEEEEEPDNLFTVYTKNNRNYVEQSLLQKFHLQPLSDMINLDGKFYFEISPQQIAIIEGSSIYGIWKADYKNLDN